ncbi:hypothetical protein J6590_098785 [Homalodisca vitripennis]|nr:hypothetical protein J6590_047006 [Homalodisca vitripennis]KAG8299527.1 hypothetical protein J6590_098785 [Homalodisca vitripennis]
MTRCLPSRGAANIAGRCDSSGATSSVVAPADFMWAVYDFLNQGVLKGIAMSTGLRGLLILHRWTFSCGALLKVLVYETSVNSVETLIAHVAAAAEVLEKPRLTI